MAIAALAAGGIAENQVPNYDIFGHQHHRSPYKDKSHFLNQEIRHPKWLEPAPAVKSRSDLIQARHRARVPDSSYDFDGDGVVGQLDHFIGSCFDKDADGSLTKSERLRAKKALDDGFLNKYVRGLDATGDAYRGCEVRQRRGVITMADNTQDISALSYPPHHNAHVQPPHNTRTALALSRSSEAKAQGAFFAQKCAAASATVDEPAPKNHRTHPRSCPIDNIRQRAEADHELARVRGGLLPQGSAVNPEREHKAIGLEHVEKPLFSTRGQLVETRKELMKREAEELALRAEEVCVPNSVRKTERYIHEYEFRQPHHVPMTLTRLKDQRKKDRIEYDMQNFARSRVAPREYPKFSDNPEVPFWLAERNEQMASASPPPAVSRSVSEPMLKVTDLPWAHEPARTTMADLPHAAHAMAAGKEASGPAYGSRTVKRWTAEMIERGEGRNKPRLFDSIQPVRIGPMDLQSLDLTSSMEPIRRAAQDRLRSDHTQNSGAAMMSRLCSDPSLGQTSEGAMAAPSPERRTLRVASKVQSEPLLRSGFDKADATQGPRFFGSASHIARLGNTGVRSGGFQHSLVSVAQERAGSSPQRAGGSQSHSRATKGGDLAMASP